MQGQQAEQTTHSANTEEEQWLSPIHQAMPDPDAKVEFYSTFGIRYIGSMVNAGPYRPPHMGRTIQRPEMLFMSENTEQPEYFSKYQVEKWRVTKNAIRKKRLIGIADNQEHMAASGVLIHLFQTYTILRLDERLDSQFGENRRWHSPGPAFIHHYLSEDNVKLWEVGIYFGNGHEVYFTETEGDKQIAVEFRNNGKVEFKAYDFKHLAHAAEDVCKFFLGDVHK